MATLGITNVKPSLKPTPIASRSVGSEDPWLPVVMLVAMERSLVSIGGPRVGFIA